MIKLVRTTTNKLCLLSSGPTLFLSMPIFAKENKMGEGTRAEESRAVCVVDVTTHAEDKSHVTMVV